MPCYYGSNCCRNISIQVGNNINGEAVSDFVGLVSISNDGKMNARNIDAIFATTTLVINLCSSCLA